MISKNKNTSKLNIILLIIIIALFFVTGFFGYSYVKTSKELAQTKVELHNKQQSIEVLNFTRLLVKDVLNSSVTVDFEKRLQLENAVRELNDVEILDQWKRFTNSTDEKIAQTEVKKLLEMLVDKSYRGV